MIHLILRQIKSTAVVVFRSSRTRIPSRTKSLGLISADSRSRNQRTHIKRSDGVSLGHETVTYGGPEARGTPRSCLPTYRDDHPSQALGSYNSSSNYQRSFIVFHSTIYSLSVQERTV
ncbi:unnamed protein product [Sphagnum troendelagicum]